MGQDKTKLELSLSVVSKLAFWYLYLPDYMSILGSHAGFQRLLKNLVHAEANARFVICYYYQNGLWELACKFHVLINAKIQTRIKINW